MAKAYKIPVGVTALRCCAAASFLMTAEHAATHSKKPSPVSAKYRLALIVGDTASAFFPSDDENSNVQLPVNTLNPANVHQ